MNVLKHLIIKIKEDKLILSIIMFILFTTWTIGLLFIDRSSIGPNNSIVGYSSLNKLFTNLFGFNKTIYDINSLANNVVYAVALCFFIYGIIQLIKRKSLFKVDIDLLILGFYYILVLIFYLFFEFVVINKRPVLIDGMLEASYPSSTTLRVITVMLTMLIVLNKRIRNIKLKNIINIITITYTVLMVLTRIISGVHWISDIIGGILLSLSLVFLYVGIVNKLKRGEFTMNDYEKLKLFWDNTLSNQTPSKQDSKFVTSEYFNNLVNQYVKSNDTILDYGCGSGWALFEIYNTTTFKEGIGLDTSINAIQYANECAKLSNMDNIKFIACNDDTLKHYSNTFDFIISVNTIDVVPDEVVYSMLDSLSKSLKQTGTMIISINPMFTPDELTSLLQMEQSGHYYYKDNIFRCNYKSDREWIKLFSKYFSVIEHNTYKLFDEERFERRLFVLKSK